MSSTLLFSSWLPLGIEGLFWFAEPRMRFELGPAVQQADVIYCLSNAAPYIMLFINRFEFSCFVHFSYGFSNQ